MIALICLYLVICPASYWIGMELRAIQELFYQIMCIIVIMGGFFKSGTQIKPCKLNLVILSMMGWLIFQYFQHKFMGYNVLTNFFLGTGVYFTIINHVKIDHIKRISKTVITVAVIASLYLGLQYLGYDLRGQFTRNVGGVPKCSFFGIEHAFGMYLGYTIPLLMSIIGIWGLLALPIVVLSYSTGALIGVVVSVLFFYWYRKRIYFWLLCIPILFGLVFFIVKIDSPMAMQKTRLDMWGKVIQDSHKQPLGYGLDAFRQDNRNGSIKYFKYPYNDTTVRVIKTGDNHLMEYGDGEKEEFKAFVEERKNMNTLDFWDHPHNEIVLILHDHGFPGLALLIAFMVLVWRRFWRSTKSLYAVTTMSILIAFFIFSMTQFPLHIARLGHILPVILGLFYISTENEWQL